MDIRVAKSELEERIKRLCTANSQKYPQWDSAIILNRVSQYYFTGTMQDGLLVIKKDGSAMYFARRSYERAAEESPLDCIYPMETYRDAALIAGRELGNTLVENEVLTVGILERLKKHFDIKQMFNIENIIFGIRAVKSPYELHWMTEAGKQHQIVMEEIIPGILREGMSEVDFTAELYAKLLKMGYHGVSRFYKYQTEIIVGQVGFGENSLYPTNFDGPGGMKGLYPAVPMFGSRERLLKKGDLVFVDFGFGLYGYHSDKTQVYMFGAKPDGEVLKAHRKCMDIQRKLADKLRPGNIPSEIYNSIISQLEPEFLNNFMGFGNRKAKFLGHGLGLYIDEHPVITNGFNVPLEENMTIALEPKKGIAGVGMVGTEDTYIVTPEGGSCITGGERDIIVV